jgi:hypothetical protein
MPAKRISGAALVAGIDNAKPSGAEIAQRLAAVLPTSPRLADVEPRRRGRPSSGGSGMPVTLRLDPNLYSGLAMHLPGLAEHGRTMPTVQDLLRAIASAIVDEPETIRTLWQKGREK